MSNAVERILHPGEVGTVDGERMNIGLATRPPPLLKPPTIGTSASFTAHACCDVDAFFAIWSLHQSSAVTPFQSADWLRSWFATLGREPGQTPLCVTVSRADAVVMLLPLVAHRQGSVSTVRFADEDVTDYNAPLLCDASMAHLSAAETRALWSAIRGSLRGHDLLLVDKMLPVIGGVANPLATALSHQPCEMFGNHLVMDDDWDTWRFSLDKTVRKEFERTWRVFNRHPDDDARFERVTDLDAALSLYRELEIQQRERMAHAGDRYRLDRPAYAALYSHRLREGLATNTVVLTALRSRGELVAALYGICDGERYVALRISHAGSAWKACAPGKLLLERTMHHLHGLGLRHIDFAIGDYFHKRVFGVTSTPLVDACVPLSVRGVPAAAKWRGRRWLKARPRV
ncbi:MAG: family N-acetyltransferase, partial [Rhizobacter sp.]|nr:family N-acetyltransferase [Rhizobacter sp.]